MDLLFVLDPLVSLKAGKDSSVAMMRAAQARGHRVWACEAPALEWRDGHVTAPCAPLELRGDDADWYRAGATQARPLAGFDAVVMRKDPPFDLDYVTATWLLSAAEHDGARVFNSPAAIRDHNEKLAIAEFARFVPPTLVSRDPAQLHAFIDGCRDVVLKRLDAMGGESIFRVRADDPNRNVIVELMSVRATMAQRYLPEIVNGDKRVLLIDGEPVPFCLARIPKAGETRGNLAAGGRGEARPLTPRDREIGEALGPPLAARGLLVVGLDVIGDCLTEINVTSPTCFREIQDQTGFDVAGRFVEALERRCAR